MRNQRQLPIALTIAGSDSGGGAGIQADLKTFAAFGVHGTCAITCLTAQNPNRVLGIQACRPEMVRLQMKAVFEALPPVAIKTGMLYSAGIVEVIANFLRSLPTVPLVVDPVMISTSGTRLLEKAAVSVLVAKLLPMATLITPNLAEAVVLTGKQIRSVEDMRTAAREIHQRFGCAALVKGGHLRGTKQAADIFFDGNHELLLAAPFVKSVRTHGTGCTYSAAVTACLASGLSLTASVSKAKEHISGAIRVSRFAARHPVLNPFWRK